MRCDSLDGVKMAVRKKLGVGILYADAIRFEPKRGEFKLLKLPGLTRPKQMALCPCPLMALNRRTYPVSQRSHDAGRGNIHDLQSLVEVVGHHQIDGIELKRICHRTVLRPYRKAA